MEKIDLEDGVKAEVFQTGIGEPLVALILPGNPAKNIYLASQILDAFLFNNGFNFLDVDEKPAFIRSKDVNRLVWAITTKKWSGGRLMMKWEPTDMSVPF